MYAKIENDLVVEYPLYEGDLQNRFPELSFPLDTHGVSVPTGYVRVQQNIFTLNPDFVYQEVTPVKSGDVYVQNWQSRASTSEERASIMSQQAMNGAMAWIDELMGIANAYRAANAASISQEELLTLVLYMGELGQLDQMPDFPDNIIWPPPPSVLL